MKAIYWRWQDQKTVNKNYMQKDLGDMLELSSTEWGTSYPLRVLRREIDIIRIDEEDEVKQ